MSHVSFAWPAADALAALVREAQRRRPGAEDDLLDLLRPSLVRFFARRFPGDAADDLAQMASIRIAGALPRIDPERAGLYISTVARNLLRTTYRHRARDLERVDDTSPEELPTHTLPADRRVEYEELVRAVHRACLEKLKPGLQEVALGLLRGDTPGEIATALDVSPVTVRTRLMRVRSILRRELAVYIDLPTALSDRSRKA